MFPTYFLYSIEQSFVVLPNFGCSSLLIFWLSPYPLYPLPTLSPLPWVDPEPPSDSTTTQSYPEWVRRQYRDTVTRIIFLWLLTIYHRFSCSRSVYPKTRTSIHHPSPSPVQALPFPGTGCFYGNTSSVILSNKKWPTPVTSQSGPFGRFIRTT